MHKKGQSILEYSILIIVVLAALIATSIYVKRSIQGRWKSAVDDFGDQYDPRTVNGVTLYTTQSSSNSSVSVVPDTGGMTTQRTDAAQTNEQITSNVIVN